MSEQNCKSDKYSDCKIKLLKIGEYDGTQKFQSQLFVGRGAIDFIMESDGIMRHYSYGSKGFDFYEYRGSYEIVYDKNDMVRQVL